MLKAGLDRRRQRVAAARTHAKIIGMRMADGRAFVIESSANLRSCRNIEQFVMTQSRSLFDFHEGWMNDVASATQPEADAREPASADAAHE